MRRVSEIHPHPAHKKSRRNGLSFCLEPPRNLIIQKHLRNAFNTEVIADKLTRGSQVSSQRTIQN